MTHDDGLSCACQATHRPQPLELNLHHIWPKAMGGSDDPDNLVALCPTAHVNVHELLRLLMRSGPLTWGEVGAIYAVPVNRHAYALAAEGYGRIRDATTP